ncbi:MAG: glycosyl transferase [Ramlibacter sp.]
MKSSIVGAAVHDRAAGDFVAGVTVSVVSHGHEALLQRLLEQIEATGSGLVAHVILTHNLPAGPTEPPPGGWSFEWTELFNARPAGFGANHNRAFTHCKTRFYCILNPDVDLIDPSVWRALMSCAWEQNAGCVYPKLLDTDGSPQDHERAAVTPAALFRRHFLRQPEVCRDWVSAAFWLVPSTVYQQLGGFDESYFMYCEDTDFCLRLQLGGWALARCEAVAVHAASRSSRRKFSYFLWHVRSLIRLWSGTVLRRYLAMRVA